MTDTGEKEFTSNFPIDPEIVVPRSVSRGGIKFTVERNPEAR